MSRQNRPKQLLPLIGGKSLLQIAADRLTGVVPPSQQYICTSEQHRHDILSTLGQFSDERILGEPAGRDTANAIGLIAAVLARQDPQAIFAVLTADHLIEPLDEFQHKLDVGYRLVEQNPSRLVTFSIRPTRPATGYGYVQRSDAIAGFDDAFHAERFVEKPDAEHAREYLDAGNFGWNSGMFVFSAATVMRALQTYLPETHAGLCEIATAWGTPEQQATLQRVYPTLKRISIDYALMEPACADESLAVCTVLMNVNWLDVGCWASFGETLETDANGNRGNTRHIELDAKNIISISDDPNHTIAAIGCENLTIVHTADATLVLSTEQAQRVKELADNVDQSLQ